MKQDKRPAGAAVKKRRFFNRISRKLMLFVVLMSMVLLALVWLLSVKLLEPMYNRRVLADLNHAADVYSAIIEKYGKFESFDKSGGVHIPSDMMEEIMDNRGLLAGKCFEVAGTDCKVLLHLHQLQSDQCLLHPNPLSQLMEYSEPQWNSTAAVNLRATTFVLGDLNFTLPDSRILPGLESTSGTRQMVVCRNINNQYSLILSTDLERVGQAADVISAQMPIIAAVLLIVSIAGAYVFSRWFTKPISAISRAAREMARGNYKVRVTPQADDELGALAGDFNTMAREVGRTSELQRDLIANVSHDLRTPLTLIKGYAETVRDLTGDNKEKRDEQLSVIVDETDRLSGLVNSVMELSKYSSGTEKLNPVQFDLAQLCDEVAYRYQNICEQSGYTLTVDAADPCTVTADPDMMSRVVHNLLANAIHHIGPDGCVALRVKPQPDAAVRVEIEDHGAGIAREDLPISLTNTTAPARTPARSAQGWGFPSQRPSSSTTAFPSVWTANPARAAFSGSSLIEPDIFSVKGPPAPAGGPLFKTTLPYKLYKKLLHKYSQLTNNRRAFSEYNNSLPYKSTLQVTHRYLRSSQIFHVCSNVFLYGNHQATPPLVAKIHSPRCRGINLTFQQLQEDDYRWKES